MGFSGRDRDAAAINRYYTAGRVSTLARQSVTDDPDRRRAIGANHSVDHAAWKIVLRHDRGENLGICAGRETLEHGADERNLDAAAVWVVWVTPGAGSVGSSGMTGASATGAAIGIGRPPVPEFIVCWTSHLGPFSNGPSRMDPVRQVGDGCA